MSVSLTFVKYLHSTWWSKRQSVWAWAQLGWWRLATMKCGPVQSVMIPPPSPSQTRMAYTKWFPKTSRKRRNSLQKWVEDHKTVL